MTTITGDATFAVTDGAGAELGRGFFALERSQIADFEFAAAGQTWTEADAVRCQCDSITDFAFHYRGDDGQWVLAWDLDGDNFGVGISVAGLDYFGTLHSGTAGGAITPALHPVPVPEPGTAPLFLLVALAVVVLGRRWSRA